MDINQHDKMEKSMPVKSNILLCIDSLGSGGAQRQLVNLGIYFKKLGHEITILVYHEEKFYLDFLKKNNIKYVFIKNKNFLDRIIKIRNFIRKNNFDKIISFLEGSNFIVTLAGFPKRDWVLILGERNANPNILRSLKLIIYRWFHFFSDYIVSNSKANINLVKKINPFLSKKRMKVIYNSVDLNYWIPKNYDSLIKNDKYNILVGATHEERKNARGMLKAISNLSEFERSKLSVKWYGRFDNSFPATVNLTKKLGLQDIVKYYPATSDIKEKMISSDIVGLFSYYEGLPNIICEAMSLGKPIMTSGIADLPIILKNTENIQFSKKNIKDIERGFRKLINTPKPKLIRLGEKNRLIAENLFDVKNSAKEYLELLKIDEV